MKRTRIYHCVHIAVSLAAVVWFGLVLPASLLVNTSHRKSLSLDSHREFRCLSPIKHRDKGLGRRVDWVVSTQSVRQSIKCYLMFVPVYKWHQMTENCVATFCDLRSAAGYALLNHSVLLCFPSQTKLADGMVKYKEYLMIISSFKLPKIKSLVCGLSFHVS